MMRAGFISLVVLVLACQSSQPPVSDTARDLTFTAPGGQVPAQRSRVDVAPCKAYEDSSTVTGKLSRRTFPGRPNYESISSGDERETGFYLTLQQPICARASLPDSRDASVEPRDSVRVIQLVLDSIGYARLRPHLASNVTVRGTMFSSFTGHHHAELLLQPVTP